MEQILDEKAFLDKYNFDNYVHITVTNPDTKDFHFTMMIQTGLDRQTARPREETRTFMVPAGGKERFVGSVANLYLDAMSKKIAQDSGKFGDMADWNAKARYYDDLIISIDDPFTDAAFVSYETAPAVAAMATETAAEVPFAAIQPDAAAIAEKQRLEAENAELRALLDKQTEPEAPTDAVADALVDEPETVQPFSSVEPKRMGRPPKATV